MTDAGTWPLGPIDAIDPLASLVAAAWIAVLLGHGAVAKLADRGLFHQHLAAYGVPEGLQPALVWALPLAEAVAALGLLTPWRVAAAALAAALLLLYGGAMAWHLARGQVLDCGCGGAPLPLSWALVGRNAVLATVAGAATLPALGRPLGLADVAVAGGAVVLGTLLHAAFTQVLRTQPARQRALSSSRRSPA